MVRTTRKDHSNQPWLTEQQQRACVCNIVVPPARDAQQLASDMKVWLASVRSSSGPRQCCSLTVSEVAVALVALAEHPQPTIGADERADQLLAWIRGVSP
jgi:hypothetical protein